MKKISLFSLFILWTWPVIFSCKNGNSQTGLASDNYTPNQPEFAVQDNGIICGAERIALYTPKLTGKRVGLVANQSARIQDKHLLDSLLELDVNVVKIFTPEHGFRGEEDAGTKIGDQVDEKTGIPLISLYGDRRRPKEEDLQGLDMMVFDIQDVGVRFYTFISTLHYVMDACAEYEVPLIVLDRPNPNGHYVDGPVLNAEFSSFVGMHEVPVVYGLTIGEYAQMINGEGWLDDGRRCKLEIIPLKNYSHQTPYELPVKPSPNLPNRKAVLLYSSLCYFEPTVVSIGRGTTKQFQVIGHPKLSGNFTFTPSPHPGAQNPKLNGEQCRGEDLSKYSAELLTDWRGINLDYLLKAYNELKDQGEFFTSTSFFDRLAGSDQLRNQIVEGMSVEDIKDSWRPGLDKYLKTRSKYLLYN